jgi:hypothetical protein
LIAIEFELDGTLGRRLCLFVLELSRIALTFSFQVVVLYYFCLLP